MTPDEVGEVAIVGAGPAGLATAIQLKRYGISPLWFEAARSGGLLWNANLVENYPGFPQGIPGPELVRLFMAQAENLLLSIVPQAVQRVAVVGDCFSLETAAGTYISRLLVVASGTQPNTFPDCMIPVDVADRVFYEVYPLWDLVGQRVAIVGAGDAAFDYALNLARNNQVFVLNRGEKVECLPLLWQRASASPRITYFQNAELLSLEKSNSDDILIKCCGGRLNLSVNYLIGAIGRQPRLDFLSQEMAAQSAQLEQNGRLYFVGDVKRGIYRQTAIAVGDGILAAMRIYRRLRGVEG